MAVRKTKAGLALKRWFKEDWKDVRTGRLVGDAKVKNGVLHIVAPQRGYLLKPQELQGEMSSSEKAKRVAQKKD